MDAKEIIEGNRLIAEFMGGKYDKDTTFPIHQDNIWIPIHGIVNCKTVEPGKGKTIQYNSSWDWLMPVVEKIETIKIEGYAINFSIMYTTAHWTPAHWGGLKTYLGRSKMDAVWLACVGFIQWYNNQKQD